MTSSADQGEQLSNDEDGTQEFERVKSILEKLGEQKYLNIFHDKKVTDDALDYIESKDEMRNVLTKDAGIPLGVAIKFSSEWFQRALDVNANTSVVKKESQKRASHVKDEALNTEADAVQTGEETQEADTCEKPPSLGHPLINDDSSPVQSKTTRKNNPREKASRVNDKSAKKSGTDSDKKKTDSSTGVKKTHCNRRLFGVKVEETRYAKGNIFEEEENREIEFKALTNESPEKLPWKIMEKARLFICGILNAGGKGTIYFGIGDSYDTTSNFSRGEVVGLEVETLKDEISKAFQSTLEDHIKSDDGKMKRSGDMTCVEIHFVPVDESGERTGRYVIEIEAKREWIFCKDNVYYFQQWTEKRGNKQKSGLHDLYKLNKDKWEDPVIRTCGSSRTVKNIEIDKDIKEPLSQMYKAWKDEMSRRQFKHPSAYEGAEAVDVQKFSNDIRESLRELNCKENSYILIANKVPPEHRGSNTLAFLQSVPWIAVFDLFDPNSKKDGLHFILNETSDRTRATLMELGDFKDPKRSECMSTRRTTWILRNQSMHESDWTRNSKDCVYRALSTYHERSPTGRIHCVFLGLSDEYLQEMADMIDSCCSIIGNDASRCITIISEKREIGSGIVKCLKPDIRKDVKAPCSMFGFPLELLKKTLIDLLLIRYEEPGATTDLPYLNGKPRPVLNKRLNALTDLEVYFPKPKLVNTIREIDKARENFYMGDVVNQLNLFHEHDIRRTKAEELTARIDKGLRRLSDPYEEVTRHVEVVTLSYESGTGATTLCRRILWDKRDKYRCAVVKTISTNTDYQIDELQKFLYEPSPRFIPPVLVLVDNFPEHQVRRLIDKISERETKCVMLNTVPIARLLEDASDEVPVLRQLDNTEIEKVKRILVDVKNKDAEGREAAAKVLERERRFIWLGLELFGRNYFDIGQRLSNHVNDVISHNLTDKLKDAYEMILHFCCLLDFYSKGRSIYPHTCAVDILFERGSLDKNNMNLTDQIHNKFGGLLLEDFSESEGYLGWRPAHFLVGEVVRKEMDVFTTARKLAIEMNTGSSYAKKFLTSDTVNVFLQREKKSDGLSEDANEPDLTLDGTIDDEFGSLEVQTRYSALIMDVMSLNQEMPSNALDLLITLNEKVTVTQHKARTWQQIARVFAYEIGMKTIPSEDPLAGLVKRINQLICPGHCPSVSPTNGFEIAHLVIDEAIKLQESYVHHLVTKGALFMAKLRDLREKVKHSAMDNTEMEEFIQEAISTSKKGIDVYDDALKKTAPDGYLHAMIGKIHTVIILLEILKRLPFFFQHKEGPEKGFQDYMTFGIQPEDMKATLCQDDLDYFISLRSNAVQWTNDLFQEIKLRRTQLYKGRETQQLTNTKIRAMKLRERFYQVTGLDRTHLTNDTGYKEDVVHDLLYQHEETPYSEWKNLPPEIVTQFYELLTNAISKETVSHDAMLIRARAALQENVSVDELSTHVELWCQKSPRSVWAHLFKYMIHFPTPNGSLKANVSIVKSSVAVCRSSLSNKRPSPRKSYAEYLHGKGIGLHSIIPSHKVSKDSQELKTMFWRSKEVYEKLERLRGQKVLGRKGVLMYKEIEIMFDNERYPKESRDDLWFCLGFTVNGPYAYDPIDNDVYKNLIKSFAKQDKKDQSRTLPTAHHGGPWAPPATSSPDESRAKNIPGRTGPPTCRPRSSPTAESNSCIPETTKPAKTKENPVAPSSSRTKKSVSSTSMSLGPKSNLTSGSWKDNQLLIIRTRCEGGLQRTFPPMWIDEEGKVHHGAYVPGAKKSSECRIHTKDPVPDKCGFAHPWKGDCRIQTVCKQCTEDGENVCQKKNEHGRKFYELGPYLDKTGEKWKRNTASSVATLSRKTEMRTKKR